MRSTQDRMNVLRITSYSTKIVCRNRLTAKNQEPTISLSELIPEAQFTQISVSVLSVLFATDLAVMFSLLSC